jgi:hypothetical protein
MLGVKSEIRDTRSTYELRTKYTHGTGGNLATSVV